MHPNSLKNLELGHGKNKPKYGNRKKQRSVTVTEEGWAKLKELLKTEYDLSVSEAIEQIGRGKLKLVKLEDLPD